MPYIGYCSNLQMSNAVFAESVLSHFILYWLFVYCSNAKHYKIMVYKIAVSFRTVIYSVQFHEIRSCSCVKGTDRMCHRLQPALLLVSA